MNYYTLMTMFSDILLFGLAVPLILFVFFYARYSNWSSTREGRSVMLQKGLFLALFFFLDVQVIFSRLAGGIENELYFGQSILRVLIYAGLTTAFWLMFRNLRKAQTQPACELTEDENNE